MSPPLLDARDLWLEYRDGTRAAHVLRGVSLDLAAGQSVGIMGPSGSGKSSLLLVLAGLRAPSRGVVRLGGVEWPSNAGASADRRRRHVGFVFQESFLVPHLTVRENARLQAASPTAVERIARLAESLGIRALLDELPGRISAGERQRSGILRALVNEPLLVVADEPTSSLDHATGLEVMDLLFQCAKGAALVVCSHDPSMLARADRTLQLRDGVLSSDVPAKP
jgi:putative ABC transport system ATP-binding protein